MLEIGTKAPDFELPDQNGEMNITGTFTPLVRIEETIVPD